MQKTRPHSDKVSSQVERLSKTGLETKAVGVPAVAKQPSIPQTRRTGSVSLRHGPKPTIKWK